MSGRLLVAYDNYSVYTQNVVEYLDSFARHSDWEVRYAHVTLGAELGFRLSEFDAVFHSHGVWLHTDGYVSEDYLAQLKSFPGVKVVFLQDEGERTDRYRAAIRDLGFHVVLTCVRSEMLERVYPRALFPNTEFIPILPAYVPDHLAARGLTERPLRERAIKIGYRATDIGARFGRLAYNKFEIGRRMREICEARGIPHDIELTTPDRIFEKRIYGTAWYDFVASCRTNLGSEGCSNIYDFDGSIEALYQKLSAERGRPPSYEEFAVYTDRLDAEFDMAQITPRVFEAAALRTAMILFPGRYSGLIEPEEHYIELKEDFSNVDAVLSRLDDLDWLQAMADRAYQRLVASGEYSYRHFVRLVEDAILRKARELGVTLQPPRRANEALDLWAEPAALASRRELPTPAPRHFVFLQYKQLSESKARLTAMYDAEIKGLNAAYDEIKRLNAMYRDEIARLNAALAETRLWRGAKRAPPTLRLLAADRLGRAALVEAVRRGPAGGRLLSQAARIVAAKRLQDGGVNLLMPFLSGSQLLVRAMPAAAQPAEEPISLSALGMALRNRRIDTLALVIDPAITGRSHLVEREHYELPDLLAWLTRRPERRALLGLSAAEALAATPASPPSHSWQPVVAKGRHAGDALARPAERDGASRAVRNAADRFGPRVLMLCNDLQIDRRILHEAQTLLGCGCDVVVLGLLGPGLPKHAIEGGVKIERIDSYELAAPRQLRLSLRDDFAAIPGDAGVGEPQTKRARRVRGALPIFGPPRLERWIAQQPRPLRGAARALLWPPYRLEILRKLAPFLSPAAQYSIYLPSLLMTPRPAALGWHWRRLRARSVRRQLQRWLASVQQAVGRDEDLDDWEMALIERGLFYRPDIVHAHDLPQLRAGWTIGRMLGVPVIYDAHEMYPEICTLPPEYQRKYRELESRFIGRVNRAITVNPFIAERQSVLYQVPKPEVILNATVLPPGFIRGTRTDKLRSALALPPDQKIVLFQGSVVLERGLDGVVQALGDVPRHIHLVILGFGDHILKLLKIAQARRVTDRVHVLDPVPQEELIHWVASADAGIIPYQAPDENYRYCSPNKLFEFIAACTPIIANDLPYLRHVVAGEGYGVVEEFDGRGGCARAIRTMFDPSLGGPDRFRSALLRTGGRYLWSEQSPTLLRIYREVVGWPNVPPLAQPAA